MTGCWKGCWVSFTDGIQKLRRPVYSRGRSYRRARYNEKEVTIEFENLIDDEDFEPAPRRILTDNETELINQRRYDALVEQQKKLDAEIDAKLRRQEDDLRLEEEAYYEATREASKVARQARQTEEMKVSQSKQKSSKVGDDFPLSSWMSDDRFSLDSSDLDAEDFDSFLEKVKARSLTSNKQVSNGVLPINSWEDALAQSVEATKIAGKSLEALKVLSPTEDRATDVDR